MIKKSIIFIFIIILLIAITVLFFTKKTNLFKGWNQELSYISGNKQEFKEKPENSIKTEILKTNSLINLDEGKEEIRNIILITLDTVRADHYSFMGYPRKTTPFIDKLANNGVLFKNAYTVVSETGPSISSIFTSLYSFEHGVFNNNIELERFRTLNEYLKEKGYTTAGFVSVTFLKKMENKGFDYFNFEPDSTNNEPSPNLNRRPADKTISIAKKWLEQISPDSKIFLWVHLFDTHLPFSNDINYSENSNDRLSKDTLVSFWTKEQGVKPDFFTGNQKESLFSVMNQYDGNLQFMDQQLESLYNFMEQKGFNQNALWIITSDHGEGLGSHSYFGHFERVYNEQMKAPIIFYNPELQNGKTIDALVENIDILPTLADLVGFEIREPISGQSLLPLVAGSKNSIRDFVFGARGEVVKTGLSEFATKYLPIKTAPPEEDFIGQLYSLQGENYKLIYSPDNQGREKLFDVNKDPNELDNLIDNPLMTLTVNDMENKIRRILNGDAETAADKGAQPDKILEESLRALGY